MRTYARRCKKTQKQGNSDDVEEDDNASKTPKAKPSKRKHKETPVQQAQKRTKATVNKQACLEEKNADQNSEKRGTNVNISKSKDADTHTNPVETEDVLPLMKINYVEKVNNWLEKSVDPEDMSNSSSASSIELWRGEEITVQERGQSLFPDEFYKCLDRPVVTVSNDKIKNMADDKATFFNKLRCTPLKKFSFIKSSTTKAEQSEDLRQTLTESGTQLSSTQPYTSDFFETETLSKQPTTTTQSDVQSLEVSKNKDNHQSMTRSDKLDIIDKGTSELIKRKHGEDPLTSTKLFTTTIDSMKEAFPSLSTIEIDQGKVYDSRRLHEEKTPRIQTIFKSPKPPKKSVPAGKKTNPIEPRTSSKLFDTDAVDIDQAFGTVSTIQLDDVSKTKRNQGKTRGNKLKAIAKISSEVIKRKHGEDPLTSTKLFTTTIGSMEEAFPSLSTIGIDQGKFYDSRRLREEKTPNKQTNFKSPKPPKKTVPAGKKTNPIEPRTSSRLFNTDAVDIDQAFGTVSTIQLDDGKSKFVSPEKYVGPIKTSTPQGKQQAGEHFHFEVDISSVNQDSSDDGIGLHFDRSDHEINSDEIVCLSETENFSEQNQRRWRYSKMHSSAERLKMTSIEIEKILKIPLCPIGTLKVSEKIPGATAGRLKFITNKRIPQHEIPLDIIVSVLN